VGLLDPMALGLRTPQVALPFDPALKLRDLTRGGLFNLIPYKQGTFPKAMVRVSDARQVDDVTNRLRNLDSSYQVFSLKDILKVVDVMFLVIEGFLACIGAIGLIVSLFGIANTMAMAVLERTREIGIMKALGARNRDIGRLFLAEAAGIGAVGGAIGLGFAWLAGLVLGWIARGAFNLPEETSLFHVSNFLAAGSLLFSVAVSVLAGYLPARRAARMDPVAALRYE
jgi:putative ABC transport system permease protein